MDAFLSLDSFQIRKAKPCADVQEEALKELSFLALV
jgi:hypothetical protein